VSATLVGFIFRNDFDGRNFFSNRNSSRIFAANSRHVSSKSYKTVAFCGRIVHSSHARWTYILVSFFVSVRGNLSTKKQAKGQVFQTLAPIRVF
jgi:hypothetical protein